MSFKPEGSLRNAFSEVMNDFSEFLRALAHIKENTTDDQLRRHLETLHGVLQEQAGQVQQAVPKAISELEAEHTAAEQTIERLRAELTDLDKQIAAVRAPQPSEPPAVAPVPRPVDADLGARLRQELLQHYGFLPSGAASRTSDTLGSVASAWGDEQPSRSPAAKKQTFDPSASVIDDESPPAPDPGDKDLWSSASE